jgi:hypothetical protein
VAAIAAATAGRDCIGLCSATGEIHGFVVPHKRFVDMLVAAAGLG